MNIKLQSGKEVYVEAFHCTPTYSGLLLGSPTKESNEKLLQDISSPVQWGQRKTLLKKSDLYTSKDVLKPIIYSAWLSSEPVNDEEKKYDGSNLILIWLGDEHKEMTLHDIIIFEIGLFNWEKYAENYQL